MVLAKPCGASIDRYYCWFLFHANLVLDESGGRENESIMKRALPEKSVIELLLCALCVLCASVVVFPKQSLTTETQRTQRVHREDFSGKPFKS